VVELALVPPDALIDVVSNEPPVPPDALIDIVSNEPLVRS